MSDQDQVSSLLYSQFSSNKVFTQWRKIWINWKDGIREKVFNSWWPAVYDTLNPNTNVIFFTADQQLREIAWFPAAKNACTINSRKWLNIWKRLNHLEQLSLFVPTLRINHFVCSKNRGKKGREWFSETVMWHFTRHLTNASIPLGNNYLLCYYKSKAFSIISVGIVDRRLLLSSYLF